MAYDANLSLMTMLSSGHVRHDGLSVGHRGGHLGPGHQVLDHEEGDEVAHGRQVMMVFVTQCDIMMTQRGDNEAREKQGRLLHCRKSVWGDREQGLSGKQKTGQSGEKIEKKETSSMR